MYSKFVLMLLGRRQGRGFVVPMVLMIGLVMVVAGVVMLQKGQQDQNSSTNQKVSAQALSGAEAGITRIQDIINNFRRLAVYPDCSVDQSPCPDTSDKSKISWANIADTLASTASPPPSNDVQDFIDNGTRCSSSTGPIQTLSTVADRSWEDLITENGQTRQYRLRRYEYIPDNPSASSEFGPPLPGRGRITIESQTSTDSVAGKSSVEVEFLIRPGTPNQIAGLWTLEGGIKGNNKVKGDVLLSDCGATPTDFTANVTGTDPSGTAYTVKRTDMIFPKLPHVYESTSKPYFGPGPSDDASIPDHTSCPTSGSTAYIPANSLGSVTSSIKLPRRNPSTGKYIDTPTFITPQQERLPGTSKGLKVFEYCVSSVDYNGGNKLLEIETIATTTKDQTSTTTLSDGTVVNDGVGVGDRFLVKFYLQNSIDITGNAQIKHTCTGYSNCKPTDFQIFGYGDVNQEICLSGNTLIETFVLAPNYAFGVNGGSGVKGTVIVRTADGGCGSSANTVVVEQLARWDELGVDPNVPPVIAPISQWQRKQVQ